MKKRFLLGLASASLAIISHAAAGNPTVGQKLTPEQIAQWGNLPVYQVGKSEFRVIPSGSTERGVTLVVNAQGIVGVSRNEVAISNVPAKTAEAQLRQAVPQPSSVQHFDTAGVTVARYADFGQAVQALGTLQSALPQAQVRLPIQFKQVPY